MKRKRPYKKSVYRALTMVLQFGINMLVPVCMMTALGIFLDRKFGTNWIMIVLFFVGAIAGAQNIYRMAKQVYDEDDRSRKEDE
ncbi:MAG: AtpZ/AtpI family protein [Lachnospiraceae bacterium]|nr:AtpZ/AtpI family protein [Lachnospiraceae bacterium]